MSYGLTSKERPSQGLKRIFREEIAFAIHLCRHPEAHRGVTVHETRKHLKQLRAALRLAAAAAGKRRHAREDRALREIANGVSDLRDAHVLWQTLCRIRETIRADSGVDPFPAIDALLSMERESFSAAFAGWRTRAIPRLHAVGKRLARWPLDELTRKQLRRAVAKSYRRGRDARAAAVENPSLEAIHAWRKEVKRLWYHLRLLRSLARAALKRVTRDARTLGDLLGRDHDLAALLARVNEERGDPALRDERVALRRIIRKRRRKLQRDAAELGARVYAAAPKAFAKRIAITTMQGRSGKK
jgi:CHAD domain-containing protein